MSKIIEDAVASLRKSLRSRRTIGEDECLFHELASAIEALDRRIDAIEPSKRRG
jgi:hypothetical protein